MTFYDKNPPYQGTYIYLMNTPSETEILKLPPRPEEPLPGECCGRGCERCVYVYYEEALQRWEEKVALLKAQQGVRE
jgi:hypothetical protein